MLKVSEHLDYFVEKDWGIIKDVSNYESYLNTDHQEDNIYFSTNKEKSCFSVQFEKDEQFQPLFLKILASYFIGIDRTPNLKLPVLIEPKLNKEGHKLDFVKMLMVSLQEPENLEHLDGLFDLKYKEDAIEVEASMFESFSVFIIIQFIHIVKVLIKKGLKKSYYYKSENLNARIKGRIDVSRHLKQNVFKNKLTYVACSYQEYGYDTPVNRFLKHVISIIQSKIANNKIFQDQEGLQEQLHYISGGFYQVGDEKIVRLDYKEKNPFYKLYNQAIALGHQILKLSDHNLSQHSPDKVTHPPFWVDMSKLFELYVFRCLRKTFPDARVLYHEKVHYQEPDFLIIHKDFKAVIDAKYKPRYQSGNPSKEDARQLSGYCRLNKIYEKLGVEKDKIIPAVIIYPSELNILQQEHSQKDDIDNDFEGVEQITDSIISNLKKLGKVRRSKAYNEFYMSEVHLECINGN